MPPNPPPISVGTTLTLDSGIARTAAVSERMPKAPCVQVQMVNRPSGDQTAVDAWGSMYPWCTVSVSNSLSTITWAWANPFSTSPSLCWMCPAIFPFTPVSSPLANRSTRKWVVMLWCRGGASAFRGIVQREHRGQHLVVHFYQPCCLFSDMGVDGSHRGHSMALIKSALSPGHHMLPQPGGRSPASGRSRWGGRRSGGSPGRWLPRPRPGSASALPVVDGPDAGVGVGASQDFAVHHARQSGVSPILGGAGHFFHAVVADGSSAQHAILAQGLA